MALTNQQVQQVFLAITGRPAEGSAVTWGANSLSVAALANAVVDIRKGADFTNSKEAFVENLYSQLLGRPSDAEGKEFWLNALNNGASYGDVLAQFVNAVLVQPSSRDLYTLQNKLSIAEKISAQVNTFQGGAAAEQSLKDIMTNVDANTTAETADSLISDFKAQNVDITNVTVKPGAEEATKGSDEHATVFNASITLGGDAISIEGSSSFADTLNLSVKGVKDEQTELNNIGTVNGIKTLNITTGSNVKTVDLTTSTDIGGAKDLTIKGSAKSNIEVDSSMNSVTTGTASDYINISGASNAVTVNGGAGIDTVEIGDNSAKATLVSIEKIAGTGNLSVAQLNGKTYTLGHKDDAIDKHAVITIDKVGSSGLNLSNLKLTDGTTTPNSFNLNGVKGGTIKLIKTDSLGNKTADAIAITADAKKVDITNFEQGDTIAFAALSTISGNDTNKLKAAASGGLTDAKGYSFVMATGSITSNEAVAKALAAANITGTTSASNKFAIFVTNGTDKSAVYYVDQKDTTAAIDKTELKLLATFDQAVKETDTLTSGTFAIV
ncbi:DUF4214 domain-containing protein [Campylobacter magnus]|uniref:DUF4214 domain-containing protein n=1 Tax=Campylobacter magnus TaxID=3026462 RepID=UPI00235E3E8E|nr:DUF4214 domain-containing protein [Campylobacter magnus]MDD0855907.1 DUF4214 domain-containing protein [Campylobacter magnus]